MKIEFLFSEIKDIEKLYQIDLIDNPSEAARREWERYYLRKDCFK